jgi:hypothetical protein
MREALLQKALEQITRPADPKGGRYFTLYAPRQKGEKGQEARHRFARRHRKNRVPHRYGMAEISLAGRHY